jgi:hypothetical protein
MRTLRRNDDGAYFLFRKERLKMGEIKARLLLQVDSIPVSLDFYMSCLGWNLLEADVGEGIVMLSILPGYQVMLAEAVAKANTDFHS